jgi:alkanesulfonate monooxygenase SsuD/methylene tetrahydromethanopterin reductase-like flavin-dependent oxidoreductase (luciferase family)
LPLLVALIGNTISELATLIAVYQSAWQAAGHPGQGEVRLRLPVYVAETPSQALDDPRASVVAYYDRLRQGYLRSLQGYEREERNRRASQFATVTYEDLLRERVVFGTPGNVAERLRALQQSVGLSGLIIEANAGGGLSAELVDRSMALFTREVVPQL